MRCCRAEPDQDSVFHGGPLPHPDLQQRTGSAGKEGTSSLEDADGGGCSEKWAQTAYLHQPWTPYWGVGGEFPTLDISFVPGVLAWTL